MPTDGPVARTESGVAQGTWRRKGIAEFLAVPYAQPPVEGLRFAPAMPHSGWEGVRACDRWGAAPPQLGARLESIVGPLGRPRQAEDCLVVNVWTPAMDPGAALPVMVWFHGGAFFCDSASNRCYDGTDLAATGRVVVVSVEYRLGALGYLYLPPSPDVPGGIANLGLSDQARSLRWVADNIHEFGGDPGSITVFGQSAGAYSIAALLAAPESASLVRRAVLQSCPFGWSAERYDLATDVSSSFLAALKAPATLDALRRAPLADILAAQAAVMSSFRRFGDLTSPFFPVVDSVHLPVDPFDAVATGAADGVDLMLGAQADEARCFVGLEPGIWEQGRDEISARLRESRGAAFANCFDDYCDSATNLTPAQSMSLLVGDDSIMFASLAVAEGRARAGSPCYQYLLTWPSPMDGGRFGSCHTLEAPFVFGDLATWADAPIIAGIPPGDFAELRGDMQESWIRFAECGCPNGAATPPWPRFTRESPLEMQFDLPSRVSASPVPARREVYRRHIRAEFDKG